MSLYNLKKEIESILQITKWSPSETQLKRIAVGLKSLSSSASLNDIRNVVSSVVGSYETMNLEGLDNSDLTTLLLMATRVKDDNE